MKTKMIAAFALLTAAMMSNTAMAQQNYLDEIAQRACTCVDKVKTNGAGENEVTLQMGMCLLQSVGPNDRDKLMNDYKVNINDPLKDGQRTGAIIGARMAAFCPATLLKMTNFVKEPGAGSSVTGNIIKVDSDGFVTFSVKENAGNTQKYVWLFPTKGGLDLPAMYNSMTGKTVTLKYETKDIFDPRIGDYRQIRIITQITEGFAKIQ
ncbi:hypothetical protein [Undibacterium squillarum]|uniref:Uncharacterized protein n=1 Tax=Undibacterium squillarum TaxID=1131567 RepID=A0ABQ2Y2D7_9BURK|nr:hypothetical protein [Undibacterium squillarum]GGX46762.1 hypothetical protein GCM10010946_26730 [Undibacterium squillarum]